MISKVIAASLLALGLTACGATTQGAVTGGALGAAAGAIIGGVIGAAGGAYAGCRSQGGCAWNQNNANHSRLYYDERARREYYIDQRDGCTYWRNGEYRAC